MPDEPEVVEHNGFEFTNVSQTTKNTVQFADNRPTVRFTEGKGAPVEDAPETDLEATAGSQDLADHASTERGASSLVVQVGGAGEANEGGS